MYNTDMPKRAELPSSAQLFRSTMIAIAAAAAILVTVVLPAEYAIDPTGVGRALGLVEMGEIKAQLAHEAEQDRAKAGAVPKTTPKEDKRSALKDIVFGAIFSPAMAQPAPTPKTADFSTKTEETSVSLKPGDYIEAKLGMKKGTKVKFKWTVTGGTVNYDMHGEFGDKSKSYAKGRASSGEEGILEAAFDGSHGWYWRNRGNAPVKVSLQTTGEYSFVVTTP